MLKFNLQIDGKFKSTTKGNTDWYYGGGEEAWSSPEAVKLGVTGVMRIGRTVGVIEAGKIVEYIWHPNDITDDGLVPKISETEVPSWKVVFAGGFGKYANGATVPANESHFEQVKEAFTVFSSADFIAPTYNYEISGNLIKEVGTVQNINFSSVYVQNDGGEQTSEVVKKNGIIIGSTNTIGDSLNVQDTLILTVSGDTYNAIGTFVAGIVKKPNSLGILEDNTIPSLTLDTNMVLIKGYNPIFYGSTITKKTDSVGIRVLNKRLTNLTNSFTLSTGTVNKFFQIFVPYDRVLSSVLHTNINDNLTTDFLASEETITISDAGAGTIAGKLYTYEIGVSFSSSQQFNITLSNI